MNRASVKGKIDGTTRVVLNPNAAPVPKRKTTDDLVKEYFEKNDAAQGKQEEPCLGENHVQNLLFWLNPTISKGAAKYLFKQLHLVNGFLSYSEFFAWWKEFDKFVQLNNKSSSNPREKIFTAKSGLHAAGFVDFFDSEENVTAFQLLLAEIPQFPRVISQWESSVQGDDWNGTFQACYNAACRDHIASAAPAESTAVMKSSSSLTASNLTASQKSQNSSVFEKLTGNRPKEADSVISDLDMESVLGIEEPRQQHATEEDLVDEGKQSEDDNTLISLREKISKFEKQRETYDSENMKSALDLAYYCGEFIEKAVEGARIVVDEYSLPDELKTVVRLHLVENSLDNQPHENSELFNFDGLLFRVVGRPAAEADQQNIAAEDEREDFTAGDHLHKIFGADYRGNSAVQAAFTELEVDKYRLAKLRRHARIAEKLKAQAAMDGTAVSPSGISKFLYSISEEDESKAVDDDNASLPRTLLSTLVDYAGYRVSVICPVMDISRRTLVYGYAPTDCVFVDSYSLVNGTLNILAKQLNLSFTTTYQVMTKKVLWHDFNSDGLDSSRKSENGTHEATRFSRGFVPMLAKDVEVHQCADGNFYLMNFQSLFPSDLPRAKSCDTDVRHLRPELVRRSKLPLSPITMGRGMSNLDIGKPTTDMSSKRKAALDSLRAEVVENETKLSNVIVHLYGEHLPAVASALDSAEYIPLDSFGLTECLHRRGVNIRAIGVLFDLCRGNWIRRLLLSEALARCCKVLHRELLRKASRAGKAVAISSQFRGRSRAADYFEQMKQLLGERQLNSVCFFNLVLGHGSKTTQFWQGGPLADLLMVKFGLDLATIVKSTMVHLPQLFLAMQYHTGVEFLDSPDYCFGNSASPEPLTPSDLAYYEHPMPVRNPALPEGETLTNPSSESPRIKFAVSFPGRFGSVERLAETFLAAEMYDDAANIFRLRLSVLFLLFPGQLSYLPRVRSRIGYNVYCLALCYYSLGKYEECITELKQFLSCRLSRGQGGLCRLFSCAAAGMMNLLSSAEFKCGLLEEAMLHYDAACNVFDFCLGASGRSQKVGEETGHPILAMTMCSLADQYHSLPGARMQARVLLTLGHEMSRLSLGPSHRITSSIAKKLGVLCLEERAYVEALTHLTVVVQAVEIWYDKSKRLRPDLSQQLLCDLCECLYLQAIAFTKRHEYPSAIHVCLSVLQRAKEFTSQSIVPPEIVASMILLSELYAKKRETVAKSIEFLMQALESIRKGRVRGIRVGTSMANLVCRILDLTISGLSLQGRNLLDNVVKETAQAIPSDIDPELELEPGKFNWAKTAEDLLAVLWSKSPKETFDEVFRRVLAKESFGVEKTDQLAKEDEYSTPAMRLTLLQKLSQCW